MVDFSHPSDDPNGHVHLEGRITTADAQALADALALVEQLRQENQALRAVIAELEQRVADLAAENKVLRGQLDEAQRPAAPFRRRDSQKVPEAQRKQPGRPKGHPGVHHAVPAHVVEHVEVPLPACPHCGGAVEGVEPIEPREVVGREAESVQGSWHQPGSRAGTTQVARG